jgi:hypothetical protein
MRLGAKMVNSILANRDKTKTGIDLLNQIFIQGGQLWERKHYMNPRVYNTLEDAQVFCWEYNETYFKRQAVLQYRVTRDGHVETNFQGIWSRPSERLLKLFTPQEKAVFGQLSMLCFE